ncbi:MAG: hypothetical protein AAFY35_05000 [Pseudomonadota bacterium]
MQFLGKKFANFYRGDQRHLDEVKRLNITDPAARMSGLLSDALHAIGSPRTKTAGRLAEAPGFERTQFAATPYYTCDMRASGFAEPRPVSKPGTACGWPLGLPTG